MWKAFSITVINLFDAINMVIGGIKGFASGFNEAGKWVEAEAAILAQESANARTVAATAMAAALIASATPLTKVK